MVAVLSEENFTAHPITRNLGAAVVMPLVRSTRLDRARDGVEGEELLRAGPASWAETAYQEQAVGPDEGVDLIVMGTHGRRGISHTISGSVAEAVLRKSHCPVIAVRSPKFGPDHRQTVPEDMSPIMHT